MTTTDNRHKVSFCTCVKARLAHVQMTLPANLAAEADNPDVEFAILDYDCPDGTADWVAANFPDEIASGRVRLGRHTPAPRFVPEHAKNMAARLATGTIVCTLDADNFLAPGTARWLSDTIQADPNTAVTHWRPSILSSIRYHAGARLLGAPRAPRDNHGRVAMSRARFDDLGGYDESRIGGWEDLDISVGARRLGMRVIPWPRDYWGGFIAHGDDLRFGSFTPDNLAISRRRMAHSPWLHRANGVQILLGRREPRVNAGGIGRGSIDVRGQAMG